VVFCLVYRHPLLWHRLRRFPEPPSVAESGLLTRKGLLQWRSFPQGNKPRRLGETARVTSGFLHDKSPHSKFWGAERWIQQFPTRLFLDKACTVPFPLALPDPACSKTLFCARLRPRTDTAQSIAIECTVAMFANWRSGAPSAGTLAKLRCAGSTNSIDRPGPDRSSALVEKNSSSPLPQRC